MKTLLFPGQSSQFCGMSIDFYEKFQEVKDIFEKASSIADFDIKHIILNEPEKLQQTEYLQIAIFVASFSCFKVLQTTEKINISKVKYLLGHSLGEYTALCIANSISFEDCIKILKKRSQLMANCAQNHPNKKLGMASVLGANMHMVSSILNKFFDEKKTEKDLFVANYNTDSQIVLSGNLDTIEEFKIFSKSELKKIINLPVSSAFHSIFMKEASVEFGKFLHDFKINDSSIEIIMNNNALPETNGDKIKVNLIENLTHGVLWWPSIKLSMSKGVSRFIQVGGKEILINMIKKENIENIKLCFVNSLETLNNFH